MAGVLSEVVKLVAVVRVAELPAGGVEGVAELKGVSQNEGVGGVLAGDGLSAGVGQRAHIGDAVAVAVESEGAGPAQAEVGAEPRPGHRPREELAAV